MKLHKFYAIRKSQNFFIVLNKNKAFRIVGMKDYLFRKNLTVKRFAGELGISTSYMYQLLRGERKPSLQLAHKIEKYSRGEFAVQRLPDEALNMKSSSYSELDVKHELETKEKRLSDLESREESIKGRFDLIEKRLAKLEEKSSSS